jgi:5-methylcytosine-specific restriction endonuclease McrA
VCQTTGRRCSETSYLEFDHVVPYGRGGSSKEASNLRLLCKAHNQYAAEGVYGKHFMERCRGKRESGEKTLSD